MTTLCLTTTHLPLYGEHLPAPVCVATINCDERMLGALQPARILTQLAHKLGLLHFALVDGELQDVPGHQFDLFH